MLLLRTFTELVNLKVVVLMIPVLSPLCVAKFYSSLVMLLVKGSARTLREMALANNWSEIANVSLLSYNKTYLIR